MPLVFTALPAPNDEGRGPGHERSPRRARPLPNQRSVPGSFLGKLVHPSPELVVEAVNPGFTEVPFAQPFLLGLPQVRLLLRAAFESFAKGLRNAPIE